VYRSVTALDLLSVQQNSGSVSSNRWGKLQIFVTRRQLQCVALDPHFSAPHRMATNDSSIGINPARTGKPEIAFEMSLLRSRFG
jgi:hypothetical protein